MPEYNVLIKNKISKKLAKCPLAVKQLFYQLIYELETEGPVQKEWPNYSKLGENEHHCHLNYRYIACWKCTENYNLTIEVYYVGSREGAPY